MIPAVADQDRWRRAAGTWPDPDRVRGRARWTVATMAVTLVPVYGWVATDHPPQPTTLVLVVLTLLPFVWIPLSALAVQSVEGANVVRDHLLRS